MPSRNDVQRILRRVRGKTVETFEAAAAAQAGWYRTDVSVPGDFNRTSDPGQFPLLQTGNAADSIYWEVEDTGDLRSTTARVVLDACGSYIHDPLHTNLGRLGMEDSFYLHYNEILAEVRDAVG